MQRVPVKQFQVQRWDGHTNQGEDGLQEVERCQLHRAIQSVHHPEQYDEESGRLPK